MCHGKSPVRSSNPTSHGAAVVVDFLPYGQVVDIDASPPPKKAKSDQDSEDEYVALIYARHQALAKEGPIDLESPYPTTVPAVPPAAPRLPPAAESFHAGHSGIEITLG